MTCSHLQALDAGIDASLDGGLDTAFTVDASRVTFGSGSLREVGERARARGIRRAAVITDRWIRKLPWLDELTRSLDHAGVDACLYDGTLVEPTDESLGLAIEFARDAKVDGFISLGGGSVIDTAKVANLYTSHPASFREYVNAPLGDGRPVPGPLAPHIACPTTSGTGSEVTGIAIFDWLQHQTKTGIASPQLRPSEAIIDPRVTLTLPPMVVAASGMDVLCHALESFTARPYTQRQRTQTRPASQGSNPWSDIGCREALALCGRHLAAAVAGDLAAREQMMWAATLAGIAFGNAGVHVPHAMAYAVAGLARDYRAPGYPDWTLVPHGIAVVVNAPSVVRATSATSPDRHLEAARLLGADTTGALPDDAGALLARRIIDMSREIQLPDGIGGVGYTTRDILPLVDRTMPQQRLLANSPIPIGRAELAQLFENALTYA